jgi:hypothetical protein
MPRGGKREGAGARLKGSSPMKSKTIRFTDSEWSQIKLKAINDKSVSDYIRKKALE